MMKQLPFLCLCITSCVFAFSLLLSCAAAPAPTAPIPDWAQSPAGTYIAQRGRGQTREAAETSAVVLAKPMSEETAHNSREEKGRI
jgi:hypothetical protein